MLASERSLNHVIEKVLGVTLVVRFLFVSLFGLSSCYSPNFKEGLPCSETRQCPEGQVCASDDRCYSEPPDFNTDSTLAALVVSAGLLEPPFEPEVTSYALPLGYSASEIVITPTAAGSGASIAISGEAVASGEASARAELAIGPSTIDIVVTAESGASTTYQVAADRGAATAQSAYVKASNTDGGDQFAIVAASGNTVVVGAPREASGSNGIGGSQVGNGSPGSGAVYVFTRNGSMWSQQAYIKASRSDQSDLFGSSVSISGDTLVVGAPGESSNATGVNGDEADETAGGSGAAYVFVRNGGTWTQQAYLKASNTEAGDQFGHWVAIRGDTIAVTAFSESSNSTGVNGLQDNNAAPNSGAVYIFVRSGTTWEQQAYVKASNTATGDRFGGDVALAGDVLAVGASQEDSSASGINGDQQDNAAQAAGAVYVYARNGASWTQQAYIKASNAEAGDAFGVAVSLAGDTLAVGALNESSNATGIDGDQDSNLAASAGAVYVFRQVGNTWLQEAYVKASNPDQDDFFGLRVGIAGNSLVVGAVGEASGSPGANGNQADNGTPEAGAAYLFARVGTTWTQQRYLKASNPDPDQFGRGVAIAETVIAVAAVGEGSSATGIDGDEVDDSEPSAGAVYIFE